MSCKTHVKCVKQAGIKQASSRLRIPLYRSQSPRNWRQINACQILVTWKFHQRCRI